MEERIQDLSSNQEKEGKYLTFTLGKEEYGLGILKIREIIEVMDITVIPQTPEYVKGVINLRGRVIPILDLRAFFGMEAVDYSERTCIIVVEVRGTNNTIVPVGMVVDSVSEVITIKGGDIEGPPGFGEGLDSGYISGMAKVGGKVKILLDIDSVLKSDDGMHHLAKQAADEFISIEANSVKEGVLL